MPRYREGAQRSSNLLDPTGQILHCNIIGDLQNGAIERALCPWSTTTTTTRDKAQQLLRIHLFQDAFNISKLVSLPSMSLLSTFTRNGANFACVFFPVPGPPQCVSVWLTFSNCMASPLESTAMRPYWCKASASHCSLVGIGLVFYESNQPPVDYGWKDESDNKMGQTWVFSQTFWRSCDLLMWLLPFIDWNKRMLQWFQIKKIFRKWYLRDIHKYE